MAEPFDEAQPTTATETTAAVTVQTPPLPHASDLLFANEPTKKLYWDRSHFDSPQAQMKAQAKSTTLYVGNLAFSTRTRHVWSHFSLVGPVKNVVMGVDRFKKTPCGFCFVEYFHRKSALAAIADLSGTKLDGRVIRVDLDAGFTPGRQYGRGVSGGQVRDDRGSTRRSSSSQSPNKIAASMDAALPSSRGNDDGSNQQAQENVKRERDNEIDGDQRDDAKKQRTE